MEQFQPQLVRPPVAVRPADAGGVVERALACTLLNSIHVSLLFCNSLWLDQPLNRLHEARPIRSPCRWRQNGEGLRDGGTADRRAATQANLFTIRRLVRTLLIHINRSLP